MKTFVLTIPRNIQRQNIFINNWKGLDYTFINGIDYKDLSHNICVTTSEGKYCNDFACLLSHIKIWEHCLTTNDSHYLILEDDTIPLVSITKLFELIDTAIERFWFDVFKLHCMPEGSVWLGYLPYNYKAIRPNNLVSAMGYMITRVAIKQLLNRITLKPSDELMWFNTWNIAIYPNVLGVVD